ncbi:hypothetical protein M422DRAFT_261815 [Sphaerobolus stellatus SS14]|uniref:Uncharacterized protein n=1 Tax=Sphaerobolus stellatus (strain SS14) TaxID=990650 RepID=A0A0C9VEM6_SPHS4|nr:hypothetical protein M422DRAFT_261815 [Sphaerobolus stellatus SS14]
MSQPDARPLAEVRTGKMKDCPILTSGHMTPLILQNWSLACKRYMKHAEKKDSEVVSYVTEAMQEPRLVAWYHTDQARIDQLTLDRYINELARRTLKKDWGSKLRDEILSTKQGSRPFMDWKIDMENMNAILTTSSPINALTSSALKNQLEANVNDDLKSSFAGEPVLATSDLQTWAFEVEEWDMRIREEAARMQRLIDTNNAVRSARRGERRTLISRITDPVITTPTSTNNNNATPRTYLPKLTDTEKSLLNEHQGCPRCHRFYVDHRAANCPMKTNNVWPDATTYTTLTAADALAAKPRVAAAAAATLTSRVAIAPYDDDTSDSYVDTHFTSPHLVTTMDTTGPNLVDFPIRTLALLDIGCPSSD